MKTLDGGLAAVGSEQKLASGPDDGLAHSHHGSLVLRVEETEGLDRVPRPLRAHGRVGGGRVDVENPAAERELPAFLDQRLARVPQLHEPARDGHGSRPLPGPQDHGAGHEVVARDRLPRHRPSRAHDDQRFVRSERRERVEPPVDGLVEGGRPVEERDGHLREDVRAGIAGKPQAELVGEAVRARDEDKHLPATRGHRADDGGGDDGPGRPRKPRDSEAVRRPPDPARKRRLDLDHAVPQARQGSSSQPSAPSRL